MAASCTYDLIKSLRIIHLSDRVRKTTSGIHNYLSIYLYLLLGTLVYELYPTQLTVLVLDELRQFGIIENIRILNHNRI